MIALGGEGIGPEVVEATCGILQDARLPVDIVWPPHGEAAVKSHGVPVPDETKAAYAGVRPIKHYEGFRSPLMNPRNIDFVIVRENSEDLYPGREADLADLARALPTLADRAGTRGRLRSRDIRGEDREPGRGRAHRTLRRRATAAARR